MVARVTLHADDHSLEKQELRESEGKLVVRQNFPQFPQVSPIFVYGDSREAPIAQIEEEIFLFFTIF